MESMDALVFVALRLVELRERRINVGSQEVRR